MPDRSQLKFYRYMVMSPDYSHVYPATSKKDAEKILKQILLHDPESSIVDARWDDGGRLFWSGTVVGHPLD